MVIYISSNHVTCATTASEVTTYGGIEICLLLLLLMLNYCWAVSYVCQYKVNMVTKVFLCRRC